MIVTNNDGVRRKEKTFMIHGGYKKKQGRNIAVTAHSERSTLDSTTAPSTLPSHPHYFTWLTRRDFFFETIVSSCGSDASSSHCLCWMGCPGMVLTNSTSEGIQKYNAQSTVFKRHWSVPALVFDGRQKNFYFAVEYLSLRKGNTGVAQWQNGCLHMLTWCCLIVHLGSIGAASQQHRCCQYCRQQHARRWHLVLECPWNHVHCKCLLSFRYHHPFATTFPFNPTP